MAILPFVRQVHQARLDYLAIPFACRRTIGFVGAANARGPFGTLAESDDLLRIAFVGVVDEYRRFRATFLLRYLKK